MKHIAIRFTFLFLFPLQQTCLHFQEKYVLLCHLISNMLSIWSSEGNNRQLTFFHSFLITAMWQCRILILMRKQKWQLLKTSSFWPFLYFNH